MKLLILSVVAALSLISLTSSFSANTGITRSKIHTKEEKLSLFTSLHGHDHDHGHGHGHDHTNNDSMASTPKSKPSSAATATATATAAAKQLSRRGMMETAFKSASILALTLTGIPKPSFAGLVQFPCDYVLMNKYHFMRAGESLLESENVLSTNPMYM